VLAAAEATGARLASMENVYTYGRPAGRVLTENLPDRAHTKKDECAAGWPANFSPRTTPDASKWQSAAPQTTSAHAAAPSPTWATASFRAALAGKTATLLGDPDQPHTYTYTYIPGIGEGLAILGEHPDAPVRCDTPLPALADKGYDGAGAGIQTPTEGANLHPDNAARNEALGCLRAQGERGIALLKARWKALNRIRLCRSASAPSPPQRSCSPPPNDQSGEKTSLLRKTSDSRRCVGGSTY